MALEVAQASAGFRGFLGAAPSGLQGVCVSRGEAGWQPPAPHAGRGCRPHSGTGRGQRTAEVMASHP